MQDFKELQDSWVHVFFSEHMEGITDRLFLVESRSVEAHLLRTQIQELSRLNQLYQNEFQRPLTREANRAISERFHSIIALLQLWDDLIGVREEIEAMIDGELDRLADTINPFSDRSVRDIVEKNINIWGILESISEPQEVGRLYQFFTIEYINQVWNESSSIDGPLQCDQVDIIDILARVKSRLTRSELNALTHTLYFTTTFWEFEYRLTDIFIPQESYEPWEIEQYLRNGIAVENFEWHITREEVVDFYHEGILTHEQVWWFLEWEEGFQEEKNDAFSLSDALSTFWFSQTLLARIQILFWRELNEQEWENLNLMIQFFLFIESNGRNTTTTGWYNVENYAGVSSAEWYFQYLTQNGGWVRQIYDTEQENPLWVTSRPWRQWDSEVTEWNLRVRRFWWNNSYERALNSIPNEIVIWSWVFQRELEKIWNPDIQSPMSLSAEDQIILFLSDLCNRRWGRECFEDIISGDRNAIVRLYVEEHHTNVDDATKALVTLAGQRVLWFSPSVVLFSPRPTERPQNIPIPTPRPVE